MKKRILSCFLALAMMLSLLPMSVLAAGSGEPKEAPEPTGKTIYVSSTGNDTNGNGTKESPYASLAKAVENTASGDTIELLSDLTSTKYAIISGKDITINGNGHSVTRGDGFIRENDLGRGGYHPAMIEVANGTKLTLVNITLDDGLKTEGDKFLEQTTGSDKQNENKVQDAIIAAYRDGGTIILGDKTVLKNFGGMSAVRIGGPGQGGKGTSTLIMKSGSKIIDDMETPRSGGVAAVWSQGGKLEMENGSEIRNISGRAIFLEDGGLATVCGSIENITANSVMTYDPAQGTGLGGGALGNGFAGIAVAARGNSTFTLGENGKITKIVSDTANQSDVAVMLDTSSTFATENKSIISDIDTIGLVDNNEGKIVIGGNVSNCNSKNVLFRLRGGGEVTFKLSETGSIAGCTTTDVGMVYLNGGKPNIEIAGTIDGFNKPALFISNNGSRDDGTVTVTKTGVIKNIEGYTNGYAIVASDPSTVTIAGTITGCSSYAVKYEPKSGSLLKIEPTATIQNNNSGKAQIYVTGGSAVDASEHAEIALKGLVGNKTINLDPFDVTLDDNCSDIKLGNASVGAANKIKESVKSEHPDWTVIGSKALWFRPSEESESVHFVVSNLYGVKKTGLFAAYIPLKADGTPEENAELTLKEVTNSKSIDGTLDGLAAGKSYALMFANNKEYTLKPDDITIYTGGGQNDEIYDNGGLPKLTLNNCIDKISNSTEVLINGTAVSGDAAAKMQAITDLFTVTYTDQEGNKITNDETPGEYTATLSWANGEKTIKIGGNDVSKDFETGTLIIRHTEDKEEAEDGTNTYPLLKSDPTEPVENAVAIAKGTNPAFYINGDANRQITDTDGISILDDSLLLEHENDNRQQLMEQKAEEYLNDPGEGKAYAFDFHYLDLVDAFNGNAWVSASYGTTVYLPYPEGTNEQTEFTLIHYMDLHREYGISGQANVEQAIKDCRLETIKTENTANGIKFDVDKAGFSPFALVWKVDAWTIQATAGENGTITPKGSVTVNAGADQTFTIQPNSGYRIQDVTVDGKSVGAVESYTFKDVTANHTIHATFTKDVDVTRYRIEASAGPGGSINPEGIVRVSEGGNQHFTITPDEGYKILDVVVDGKSVGPVDEYTFKNVREWHTIEVTFTKLPANPDDSGVSDWLDTENHMAYLNGYPGEVFGPKQNMTRAEAAQMFYNLLLEKNVPITVSFTDVNDNAWYAKAVNTLASLGMIQGVEGNRFEPDRSITRAEFTAIAMRFTDGDTKGENIFSDVHPDQWFYDEVVGSIQYGWINGYEDDTFRPNNTITRAEVATITNRMLDREADRGYVDAHADELRLFSDVDKGYWAYYTIVEASNAHEYTKDHNNEFWKNA